MRWENLFDELESQLEHELGADQIDLRAEEERLRLGRLSLRDRLVSITASSEPGTAADIRLQLRNGDGVLMRPHTFGKDWMAGDLVEPSHRRSQCVLSLAAVVAVLPEREQLMMSMISAPPAAEGTQLIDRIGLPFVLRDLCRRRAGIEVISLAGRMFGTIDRVGRDHLDLAVHQPGSPRREIRVSHYLIIPLEHILYLRI